MKKEDIKADAVLRPCSSSACPIARPCVLVVTDDFENMVELRVRIPFDAMYKAGLIKGYHVLHRGRISRSIGIPADISTIDVVWVQRVPAERVLFLVDVLSQQFVYDIDDNLLVAPRYHDPFSHTVMEIVRTLLRAAKVVTFTNVRLLRSLEKRSGVLLESKSSIAPNLTEEVNALRDASNPQALLLAVSGHLPLTSSYEGFAEGVKRFLRRRSLPVFYIGGEANDLSALSQNARAAGFLNYFTYREVLRRSNAMAIAPLEGRGDPLTREFVESKSDIKMVEFGSYGVPAVYADVVPYQDTPLQCGPLADMGDPGSVEDALNRVFYSAHKVKAAAEESVRQHRLAVTSVATTWFPALEAGRLAKPISLELLLKREAGYATLSLSPDEQLAVLRDRRRPVRANGDQPPSPSSPPMIPPSSRGPTQLAARQFFGLGRKANVRIRCDHPPLFDSEFYIERYPDVRTSGMEPYQYFLEHGIAERRNPNAFFDTQWYISKHPDAGLPGVNPLDHYLSMGAHSGVDPSPRFSARLYRMLNPAIGDINPLEHFLGRLKRHRCRLKRLR